MAIAQVCMAIAQVCKFCGTFWLITSVSLWFVRHGDCKHVIFFVLMRPQPSRGKIGQIEQLQNQAKVNVDTIRKFMEQDFEFFDRC
jgi:hypothetical protein